MTKHQDYEIAYFSWKKNDLVFFFFFLQLPILHSHWFNCEDWLMIPWLQIPKKVPQTHIMDLNDKTCKLTPTKKPILNTGLAYLVFNCLKAILCLAKSPFSFINLGEMCYFDKKPLWRTQKQRYLNQSNIQMQYIEFSWLLNHLLKTSTTRHSTQLSLAKSLTWKYRRSMIWYHQLE